MLVAFGFDTLGVVAGDMFFVDPEPLAGQESAERGVRLELRLTDADAPQGSIYAGVPVTFGRPLWRVDLFGSVDSAPGTLDRAHHHPRFEGWEPGPRQFVPELSADPVGWVSAQLADVDATLERAGVGLDVVGPRERSALAGSAAEIVAAIRRLLDGVDAGVLAPAPPEMVGAARTGWL